MLQHIHQQTAAPDLSAAQGNNHLCPLPLPPAHNAVLSSGGHSNNNVVAVAAYLSRTSLRGFGSVRGFELVQACGARVLYGVAKGSRDLVRFGPGESIRRVAGRVDRARPGYAGAGCLVSLRRALTPCDTSG